MSTSGIGPTGFRWCLLGSGGAHNPSLQTGRLTATAELKRLGGLAAMQRQYTLKQGQYLAFIYYYTKIHRCPPSEADMQRYFKISPPAVHQMVVSLEKQGFIEKTPGQARSIRLLLKREQLPDLV